MKTTPSERQYIRDIDLDITEEVCPMTFVKTRLLIEEMNSGDLAKILIRGDEPIKSVPASIIELGHKIVSFEQLQGQPSDGVRLLIIKKS